MIVGDAEYPEPYIVQIVGHLTGSRKAGVGSRLILIVDQGFLIDPVDIKVCVEIPHILIAVGKIVSFTACTAVCLFVNALVDQIVASGGKAQGCYLRGRFRHWRCCRRRRRVGLYGGGQIELYAGAAE